MEFKSSTPTATEPEKTSLTGEPEKKNFTSRELAASESLLPPRDYLLKVVLPTSIFRALAFPAAAYLFGERDLSVLVPLSIAFVVFAALVDAVLYAWRRKKKRTAV